ncbi:MAG: type III secretion inner membrane ring lipoprotein SctJ [Salinarimonas sp.]|nr:type III secretion inner membrane ring lipoprotein SctJ [Salinarimonas sp.]
MPDRFRPLVVTLCLFLAACQVELYGNLSQREANEMIAVLARAGIEASRDEVGDNLFRVMVDESRMADAVEALAGAGLPAERYQSLGEIFPGDGLIVSPYEQRIRTMHALNQEIARSISTISGVRNARVHIVLPELDLRGQPMNRPSASILIHHAPGLDTEPLATRVRMLVANAVQGMDFRNVAVAFFDTSAGMPAGVMPSGAETASDESNVAATMVNARAAQNLVAAAAPDHASVDVGEPSAPFLTRIAPYIFWAAALAMAIGAGFLTWRQRVAARGTP